MKNVSLRSNYYYYKLLNKGEAIKTDSVQSSSNTCKNCVLKIYSRDGNFLNAI